MKKVDFHCHPLSHRYYFQGLAPKSLTDYDKAAVERMIQDGIRRGLDGIALTDHNMATGSFYGKWWAEKERLPIKVITGAEYSLLYDGAEIHILGLGIEDHLEHSIHLEPRALIDKIHDVGGIAVLAHPHYYNISVYEELAELVDGIEYYNGVNASINPDNRYFRRMEMDNYSGLRTYGSDFHLSRHTMTSEQQDAFFDIDDELFAQLTGILSRD